MANCRAVEHFYLKFCFPAASAILAAALKIQKNLFSKRVRRGEKGLNQESPFLKAKQIGIIWLDSHKGNIFCSNMTDTKNGQKRIRHSRKFLRNKMLKGKQNKGHGDQIVLHNRIVLFLTVLYFQLCSFIDSKVNRQLY